MDAKERLEVVRALLEENLGLPVRIDEVDTLIRGTMPPELKARVVPPDLPSTLVYIGHDLADQPVAQRMVAVMLVDTFGRADHPDVVAWRDALRNTLVSPDRVIAFAEMLVQAGAVNKGGFDEDAMHDLALLAERHA